MTGTDLKEMIKKEGNKYVLYSKDGNKILGKFDSETEAKKREQEINYFKHKGAKESEGYAMTHDGHLILAEGGRLLAEDVNMSQMDDGELQQARKMFMGKYAEAYKAFMACGDDRYSSTDGVCAMKDMDYYSAIVSRLQYAMMDRLLPLE